jgi:hypothetical protein
MIREYCLGNIFLLYNKRGTIEVMALLYPCPILGDHAYDKKLV